MRVQDYRARIEAEFAEFFAASRTASVTAALSPEAIWQSALDLLSKPEAPAAVRIQALQVLQAGTFLGHKFDPVRTKYVEALHRAAKDDDVGVRGFALDVLIALRESGID